MLIISTSKSNIKFVVLLKGFCLFSMAQQTGARTVASKGLSHELEWAFLLYFLG
jgi:hypothetical protein